MTFKEAAYKILKKKGVPLHYEEIARIAVKRQLIETQGETPERTMHAILSRDIDKKGKESLFEKRDKGFFTLKKLDHNLKIIFPEPDEDEIPERKNMNLFIGKAGEYLVAAELLFKGFNATILPVDEGLDIVAKKKDKVFNIQVKTANKNNQNKYNFNLRVSSFEKFNQDTVFYIFVLKDEKDKKFIILPFKIIEAWTEKEIIRKAVDDKYYIVPIKQAKKDFYMREEKLDKYLNNWKLIR